MVSDIMDNRLAESSWRTVQRGLDLWTAVARERGWDRLLRTDDPDRGGKLTTFVCSLMTDTDLVWSSIEGYVWGVRTWMQLQHQADPINGCLHWGAFMDAVKVMTWVPREPRKRVPMELISRMLDYILAHPDEFWLQQMGFFILVLLYTFSRTECPCPKSHGGREQYDPEVHFNVEDFDIAFPLPSRRAMKIRFRAIKQATLARRQPW